MSDDEMAENYARRYPNHERSGIYLAFLAGIRYGREHERERAAKVAERITDERDARRTDGGDLTRNYYGGGASAGREISAAIRKGSQ